MKESQLGGSRMPKVRAINQPLGDSAREHLVNLLSREASDRFDAVYMSVAFAKGSGVKEIEEPLVQLYFSRWVRHCHCRYRSSGYIASSVRAVARNGSESLRIPRKHLEDLSSQIIPVHAGGGARRCCHNRLEQPDLWRPLRELRILSTA